MNITIQRKSERSVLHGNRERVQGDETASEMQVINIVFNATILLSVAGVAISLSLQFEIASDYGQFSTPNYPKNYPVDMTCRWTISVVSGARILLNFTDFRVEKNKKCLYDYLVIKESRNGWGKLSSRFCGHGTIQIYLSEGNKVQVIFASDKLGKVDKGFTAQWKAADVKGRPLVKPDPNRDLYQGNQKYVSRSFPKGLASSSEMGTNCSCDTTVQDSFTRTVNMIALQKNHLAQGSLRPIDAVRLAQPNSTKAPEKHDKYDSDSAKHTEDLASRNRRLLILLGSFLVLLSIVTIIIIVLTGRRHVTASKKGHADLKPGDLWSTGHSPARHSPQGFRIVDGDVIIVSTDGRVLGQPKKRCNIPSICASETFSKPTDVYMQPCQGNMLEDGAFNLIHSRQHYLVVQSDGCSKDNNYDDNLSDSTEEYY
ncbi:uncharacterized protein LOC135689167 [Rhopilema esculentum]|uniref:uncharacterized protein LOC135689167 n=1 Tax=Rhopilema esculentum TaxID=499914 RepID=UPI0031D403AC